MKEELYHYTSLQALFSIISTQTLWLSNLSNSNDPNELYLSCEEYNQYLKNEMLDPYHGESYIQKNNRIIGDIYGISFTVSKDNLSQWERYGDNRAGVAINIDANLIQKLLEQKYDFKFELYRVRYTEQQKINFIKDLVKKKKNYDYKCPIQEFVIDGLYYIFHYSTARVIFKKPKFNIEKEYRLYHDPTYCDFMEELLKDTKNLSDTKQRLILRNKKIKEELKLSNNDKQYSIMRNGINSYLSFNLKLLGDDYTKIFKEIILGPKCTQNEKELKNFLNSYCFDPIIKKSEIDIR